MYQRFAIRMHVERVENGQFLATSADRMTPDQILAGADDEHVGVEADPHGTSRKTSSSTW